MDNIWQQHRTFILKIMAGLGICLVIWVIGSGVGGTSLTVLANQNAGSRSTIQRQRVPRSSDTEKFRTATRILEERIRFVGSRVGETRVGMELVDGLIHEILALINKDSERLANRYITLSRTSATSCIIGLAGDAKEHLITRAGMANVVIDEDIGFDFLRMEASQLTRYLLTLKTIVSTMILAVDARVDEIKAVTIGSPLMIGAAGEEQFMRELPIALQVRGSAKSILGLLAELTNPERPVPVKELRRMYRDKSARDDDTIFMEIEIAALQILLKE